MDTTWELHKPYLQKSTLLMSLLKRAEMTGMRNIEEEKEELPKPGETGMEQDLRGRIRGSRDSVMVRMPHHHHHVLPHQLRSGQALASHQCVLGLIPGSCIICVLVSLLLILYFAPRAFSPSTLVFPPPQKPTLFKFQLNPGMHRHYF